MRAALRTAPTGTGPLRAVPSDDGALRGWQPERPFNP